MNERQMLIGIVEGIQEDDIWLDDWCPVCHEHPSHDHGGKDCPLKAAIEVLVNGSREDKVERIRELNKLLITKEEQIALLQKRLSSFPRPT